MCTKYVTLIFQNLSLISTFNCPQNSQFSIKSSTFYTKLCTSVLFHDIAIKQMDRYTFNPHNKDPKSFTPVKIKGGHLHGLGHI